jgi:hypothetical protein
MAVTGDDFGIVKMTAQGDEVFGSKIISYMRWVGATTAGHTLSITDNDGHVLWESMADGPYFLDIHPLFKLTKGIKINQMSSGYVLVYYK